MRSEKIKKAFTFIELIITVTIIGILATISYISMTQYWSQAKDSVRVQDLQNISDVLEYSFVHWWSLPTPNWFLAQEEFNWIQFETWTFWWDKVKEYFSWKLAKLPLDPDKNTEYKYSLSKNWKYYIIEATLDNWESYKVSNLMEHNKWNLALNNNQNNGWNNNQNWQNGQNQLWPDNTPPTFSAADWTVINTPYWRQPDFRQITATDDGPGNVTVTWTPQTIDVMTSQKSTPVKYTAVDQAGNSASITINYKVWRKNTYPEFVDVAGQVIPSWKVIELNKWQAVNHWNIKAKDELDWNLQVSRNKDVNVNQVWEQMVTYTARNSWWNSSSLLIIYKIKDPSAGKQWLWPKKEDDCLSSYTLAGTKEVIITSMKPGCKKTEITIPETIWWNPVKEINANVFKGKQITSLNAPSIESVWNYSFQSSKLTSINLPSATTIWEEAFKGSQLTSINLPSATTIWANAFGSSKLTNINLPLATTIWAYAFYNNKLTNINLPLVTTIWLDAFQGNQLTSINLPLATTIREGAFQDNQLTSINLPSVTTIWGEAFKGNQLTSINLSSATTIWNYAFLYNQLTSINLPLAITIWVGAFQNNQLTSINLPKVETIESAAFADNQLTSINLPSVTYISRRAFQNNQLTSINLPKVETIEFDAFQNNNFIEVTLPASLKELWSYVFKWNWVLTIRNNSNLTEEQIKQAFDYEKVREYYDKNWVVHCRKNWNPCK